MAQTDSPTAFVVHPLWFRFTHWVNVVAVVIMVTSGWRIYNASPVFPFRIPREITLGGWLGGALQWHFAAMWLFVANGLIYLLLNLLTGRLRRRLLPVSPRQVVADLTAALRGHLRHDDPTHYNAVQKVAYLGTVVLLAVLVLSGLAIWKPVQFPLLRDLMGGFDNARVVHFIAMAAVVAFIGVHVVMVALVPRSLLYMLGFRAPVTGAAQATYAQPTQPTVSGSIQ
jgi:thiosulfate reductase cytochrome b subunit